MPAGPEQSEEESTCQGECEAREVNPRIHGHFEMAIGGVPAVQQDQEQVCACEARSAADDGDEYCLGQELFHQAAPA